MSGTTSESFEIILETGDGCIGNFSFRTEQEYLEYLKYRDDGLRIPDKWREVRKVTRTVEFIRRYEIANG